MLQETHPVIRVHVENGPKMATDPDFFLFVSHVSEDRSSAMEIVAELERRNVKCWIAPRDVRPGQPFDDEIVDAIESSRAMLLVFSDACNENEYIRREVTVAGESHKLIIPFRIEDARPRHGLRVRLSDLHWIDGFVARERAISELAGRFTGPEPKEARRGNDGHFQQGTEDEPHEEANRQSVVAAKDVLRTNALRRLVGRPLGSNARRRGRVWIRISGAVILSAVVVIGGWHVYRNYQTAVTRQEAAAPAASGTKEPVATVEMDKPHTGDLARQKAATPQAVGDLLRKGEEAQSRKDYPEALRQYRIAAEQGNAAAQARVGIIYENGWGVARDYIEALGWYRKAAEQGDPDGQARLAELYLYGHGVTPDYAAAMLWARKADDQGNSDARCIIGTLYERGLGVSQDHAQAMTWFRKAADQENATAQNGIGVLYDKGLGIPQDFAQAMRWYRKAAEQGNPTAQKNIGVLYAEGRGAPRNYAEAMTWFRKSADQGEPDAQRDIGLIYQKGGYGVSRDYAEALRWYRKAAEQGNAGAQQNIGRLYFEGWGVPKDQNQARRWWEMAAAGGNEEAKAALMTHFGQAK